jgi:tryptophanyl-tRNA synthetase
MPEQRVVLSGIQPSGRVHVGNYFGAVAQFHELLAKGYRCYYFLANYHTLTSVRDPAEMRALTHDAAVSYLAMGLDPEKATIYRQSDIPEVCELQWILTTLAPMGMLNLCHAYKDKVARGLNADHGLFAYPVLQAADILIVRSNLVPVGKDQKQHIEVTRDLAIRFNNHYGDVLTIPEGYIPEEVAVVPGTDGEKMSKSYGNTIDLFGSAKEVKKSIMGIVTDSKGVDEPKDPDTNNVYNIFKLFLDADERREWEDRFRTGGMGYGEVKKALHARFLEFFGPMRDRYEELQKHPDDVEDVFADGAKRAREVTGPLIEQVREAVGIPAARK